MSTNITRPAGTAANGTAQSFFTLKKTLLGAFTALSILLVAALGWKATDAWQTYGSAKRAQEFDVGANQFIRGLYVVLLERLAENNGLQAADIASPAVRQEIDGYRKSERENFDPGLAILERQSFPDKEQLVRDLRAALDAANTARQQADRALGEPRDRRDPALLKDFVPTLTKSVDAALSMWFAALHKAAGTDPVLAKLAVIKEIGWMMRDMSGRERANLSTAIAAGVPLTPDQLAANAGFRARVDVLWQELEHLTRDPQTPVTIGAAMAGARKEYFDGFVPLAEQIRKLSADGAKYPMSAKQYVETTTPQIGALLEVLYAAGKASEERTTLMLSNSFAALLAVGLLFALGLALIVAAAVIVVGRVTGPLALLGAAVQRLATGEYSVAVPMAGRGDELGAMADAVRVFKENGLQKQRMEEEQTKARAEQDRRQKAVEEHIRGFDQAVTGSLKMLASASTELETTATSMSGTAEEANRQAAAVATASQQASANVHTVASAAEELSGSISEISRQVAESTRIAGQATDEASRTNAQIQGLAEAAQRIGDVVKLINDIAGQTNLLALNATIEAARAGEAGKGFAVVASEVKSLANQTAKATEEIGAKIAEMQAATTKSVEAVGTIGQTIARINEIATTIASAVEEQGASTKEIARNVQQASAGTSEVSSNIAGVTKAASDTGAAASQVLGASGELSKQAETLRAEVDGFLAKIRAA